MVDNFAFLELSKGLNELSKSVTERREIALDKASEFMLAQFENATPVETGRTKSSWVVQKKYKGVRYINNTALTQKNIPIINLLEFGRKGKPFVRKIYDAKIKQAEQIFSEEIIKNE